MIFPSLNDSTILSLRVNYMVKVHFLLSDVAFLGSSSENMKETQV